MIYTLGINSSSTDLEETTLEFVLDYFKEKEFIQYDSETNGFDVYNKNLLCFQLGDRNNQFVIIPQYLQYFKELLENKTLIGQNLKFDLRFLYHQDIFPNKVYDTFLAEGILYCGIKYHKKGLAYIAKNRLGIDIDKSVRDTIGDILTDPIIKYAAGDVMYLEDIRDSQLKEIAEKDLGKVLHIENNFVLPLAYIEYCGFKLNVEQWKKKCEKDIKAAKEALDKLDFYILDSKNMSFIKTQLDLFSSEIKTNINWDSPKQVIEYFKALDIPVTFEDKGEIKESVDAKVVGKYKEKYPIVKDYLDYKEKQTICSRYGETFLKQVKPETGRIHTNYYQILDTGRISSGGKNRQTKEEYINMQNIPSDDETRSCFISTEGNILIDCDYSGQENIILACKSLDPELLNFYDCGLSDLHSFTAFNMYPEIRQTLGETIDNTVLKRIKKEFEKLRYNAKSAGFAIAYGGNATTIANNENIPIEDAENVYNKYFEAFPGLAAYFNIAKQQGLRDGFIYHNDISRRKSFLCNHQEYLDLKKELTKDFWDEYRPYKKAEEFRRENDPKSLPDKHYLRLKKKVKRFFEIKGEIERMGLNYPKMYGVLKFRELLER